MTDRPGFYPQNDIHLYKINNLKGMEIHMDLVKQYQDYFIENSENFLDYPDYSTIIESAGYYTESYVGKSSTLLQAEEVLGELMESMKNDPVADYTNDPRSLELSNLLKKQFGFKKVHLLWHRTAEMQSGHIYTSLISSKIFTEGNKLLRLNNKRGYFDQEGVHTCVINLSSTLSSHTMVTPSEYLAIIVHEIGHNFDYSIYMMISVVLNMLTAIVKNGKNSVSIVKRSPGWEKSLASVTLGVIIANTSLKQKFDVFVTQWIEGVKDQFKYMKAFSLFMKKIYLQSPEVLNL